jgi:hypothetical protein
MWRDTLLSIQIIHDITELAAAREGLVGERELLATTLASIGDSVIVTDPLRRCHLPKCGPSRKSFTTWECCRFSKYIDFRRYAIMSRAYSRPGASKMGESSRTRQFLFSTLFSSCADRRRVQWFGIPSRGSAPLRTGGSTAIV